MVYNHQTHCPSKTCMRLLRVVERVCCNTKNISFSFFKRLTSLHNNQINISLFLISIGFTIIFAVRWGIFLIV